MEYCYECGTRLEKCYLQGEGMVPYCKKCGQYRFPIFNTAISTVIFNRKKDKILLIQQYGKGRNVLVAGYVNQGESAEHALRREVQEEMGLCVTDCRFNKSEYFSPSNTLMLNFASEVSSESLEGMTKEVDYAAWYSVQEALETIYHGSLAERFLLSCLSEQKDWIETS